MTLRLCVDSISCFFCCVFSLNFLVTTLVSQPYLRPSQFETLLAFKNEFSICNDSVTSSWTEDTISFDGVVFDGETGSVTELHLGGACLSGSLKSNSCLYRFQHLRYLDLSSNDFSSSFPAEFGRLTNLESLDLHHNGFTGEVPSSICNLSRLTFMDLSINKLTGGFPLIHNLTELSYITLSYNNFSGTIPSYLFTMPSLLYLDLHQNHFSGPLDFPSSDSPYMFESLNLGNNLFSGQILEPISNLVNLIYLDLSFLNITFPFNLTFMPSLEYLDISGNNVSRLNMSSEYVFSTALIEVHLSSCNIHEFPEVLKTLPNLQHLDISKNKLKGKVPEWLWSLPSLTAVRLAHNSLNGFEGSPDVLLGSSLLVLDFSSNAFEGSFPLIPRSMEFMSASNNQFTGYLPVTLCDSVFLNVLDLSNNDFSGLIPGCFGESLQVLNLSNNHLEGELPDMFYGSGLLTTIDVGHNQITGKLPRSLADCTGLEILNVESNHISDTFPFWLKTLPELKVILLRSNRFHGPISSPRGHLSFPQLRIIDISHNSFTGSLPPNYFVDWSAPLISMPEGDNFPKYMVHLGYKVPNYFLRPEGARKNTYLLDIGWPSYFSMHLRNKGSNMELEKILETYRAIDFSGNRLGGQIPESIGLLKSLIVLDLSNNNFTGQIPSSLAKLTQLESLDLSRNQLSGKIPQELSVLTFWGYINMSHNELTGQIPQSPQIGGQPKSSFEGNIDLCGPPLQETCFRENGTTPPPKLLKQENLLNWKAVAIGYGPGLLFGVVIAQVFASYKPVLFFKLFRL